jgi:predicted membrane channel-forming protein YqfA (hemolysin III family)
MLLAPTYTHLLSDCLVNIHTHLIPFLLWGINLLTLVLTVPDHADAFDVPEILFMCFALMCLSSSAIWHTMSGCADHRSVELCARIDYVGIGWCVFIPLCVTFPPSTPSVIKVISTLLHLLCHLILKSFSFLSSG